MINSLLLLVTKMPYFIASNATLYHPKCHILTGKMPHFNKHKVWHSGEWNVAFGMIKCGVLRVFYRIYKGVPI